VGRIRSGLGATNHPADPISAGWMTASSTGPAVPAAALALKDRLKQLSVDAADVAACAGLARKGEPIEGRGDEKPGPEQKQYSMHSFGAVFAEVRVDPDLGEVRVARFVGAYGVGRILNRKTATSQMYGGIIYGLAMALQEH